MLNPRSPNLETYNFIPQIYVFMLYTGSNQQMVFYPRTYPRAFFSFILFLFINGTTSASFYFQTALIANCYTINGSNCSLINPAFWTGGAAPSAPGDSAFVTSNDINPVTLFLSNSTLDIASLTISGSVLIDVEFGSLLKVCFFIIQLVFTGSYRFW